MKSLRFVVLGSCLASISIFEPAAWAQSAPSAASGSPPPSAGASNQGAAAASDTAPASAPPAPSPAPIAAPLSVPPPVSVPPPAPRPTSTVLEISTLSALRDRGTITQAEYDAAMKDLGNSTGETIAGDTPSLVLGKWSTTVYGFVEADFINDSTQSFSDLAGNASVQRQTLSPLQNTIGGLTTYAGNHGRTQFSIRNSRFGIQMRAPETYGVRASGFLETDFLGYVPSPSYTNGAPTEATYFTSPSLRLRHAVIRLETPVVDVLFGQYWDLFGWQGVYQPNTVEIQGLPGQLYARNPQLRVSKKVASDAVSFEIAVAALRPPSRDSEVPEIQGGIRFALPFWKGIVTNGATATSVMPFSIAVTSDYRHFAVPEMNLLPQNDIGLDTYAGAIDIFIPVIPAKHLSDHALSIVAEGATGTATADMYTGLTSGSYNATSGVAAGPSPVFPVIFNNTSLATAPTYPQDVDNGLVDFCPINKGMSISGCNGNVGSLVGIQWTTLLAGLQYYLPGLGGHVWLSGNVSYQHSSNIQDFTRNGAPTMTATYYGSPNYAVRQAEVFADGNIFWQIVPAARVGAEYANFNDKYVDGFHGVNNRFQLSAFLIF
jgi:hypothetical protein